MRDITKDLEERLDARRKDKARYLSLADEADADVVAISKLLEQERARNSAPTVYFGGGTYMSPAREKAQPRMPIEDFILKVLKESPKTKEQVKELAEAGGYFAPGDSPGRVVHAHVLNLVRSNKAKDVGNGQFYAAPTLLETAQIVHREFSKLVEPKS